MTLLVVGMGTVFAFLVLLVVAMRASACFLGRFFAEPGETEPQTLAVIPLPEIAAAVAAAHAHLSPPGRNPPQ